MGESLRTKYLETHRAQAAKAFAKHVVTKESEGRWLLQRIHADGKPEWTFAAEVIALAGGALYVGGDIDHVVFAHGPQDPEARVRWMGECNDLGYYVPQKARVGTRSKNAVEEWDADVAHEELAAFLEECRSEDGHLHEDESDFDEHQYEIAMRSDERHEFYDAAIKAFGDDSWESVGDMGEVLSPAVIYTHAALARLCVILRERESAAVEGAVQHA